MHGAREELIALAVANGGNTRGDAKFDLDGAAATLAHYAELGATLGGSRLLGAFEQDRAKARALTVAGWRVIRVTPRQLTESLAADLHALVSPALWRLG